VLQKSKKCCRNQRSVAEIKEVLQKSKVRRKTMGKDRVMTELDEYLTTQEEDYVDPDQFKRDKEEYLADHDDSWINQPKEETMPSVIFDMPKSKKTVDLADIKKPSDLKDLLSDGKLQKEDKHESSRTSR
jgi:hypothetical protein